MQDNIDQEEKERSEKRELL